MKNIFKMLISTALTVMLVISVFSFSASAAASSSISFNKKAYSVGESVKVTVRVSDSAALLVVSTDISYNASVLKYISVSGADATGGNGAIKIVDDNLSTLSKVAKSGSYVLNFTAIANGTASVSSSMEVTYRDSDGSSNPRSSATAQVAVSTNANLASLRVTGASISPSFSASKTEYTATVKNSVTKVTVSTGVADGGATVIGAGTFNLNVGENRQTLTVTAADGKAKKTYNITIKRLTAEETAALEEQERANDPLLVTIEGVDYHIIKDITSIAVPGGYIASTATYGSTQVGTINDTSGSYQLYYLTADADETKTPIIFFCNEVGEFSRVPYIMANGKLYIVETPETTFIAKSEYIKSTMQIAGCDVTAYEFVDSKMSEFRIIYCYCDGKREFYRYDTAMNILQRSPDFTADSVTKAEVKTENKDLFSRFKALSSMAKIIIILIFISILCVIALIILLLIRVFGKKKHNTFLDDDAHLIFDDTDIEDTFLMGNEDTFDDNSEHTEK